MYGVIVFDEITLDYQRNGSLKYVFFNQKRRDYEKETFSITFIS